MCTPAGASPHPARVPLRHRVPSPSRARGWPALDAAGRPQASAARTGACGAGEAARLGRLRQESGRAARKDGCKHKTGSKEDSGTVVPKAAWRGGLSTGPRETHWGGGDDSRQPCLPTYWQGEGASQAQDQTMAGWHLRGRAIEEGSATPQARSGGGPGEGFLADTRWRNGGWVHGELQMPEDLLDHLTVRDGRDDPQRPPLTPGAARHIDRKHVLQQSCPAPARRYRTVLLFLYALLARRGDNRPTQVAVRCQTAAIAHQVDARQGHQGRQLLQEFHRRESNPRGAIGPRMGEGVDEIAVGIFLETLQGHRAAGGITDQACQLIAPVRRDLSVGVQGKPVDAGTAGTCECGRLALVTKSRTDAPDLLSGPLSTGDALLHRGRQGPGELWGVIHQGVKACCHRGVETRLLHQLLAQPPPGRRVCQRVAAVS